MAKGVNSIPATKLQSCVVTSLFMGSPRVSPRRKLLVRSHPGLQFSLSQSAALESRTHGRTMASYIGSKGLLEPAACHNWPRAPSLLLCGRLHLSHTQPQALATDLTLNLSCIPSLCVHRGIGEHPAAFREPLPLTARTELSSCTPGVTDITPGPLFGELYKRVQPIYLPLVPVGEKFQREMGSRL